MTRTQGAWLILVSIGLCGCGQSSGNSASSPQAPTITLSAAAFEDPLTPEDVAAFLTICRALPHGQPPEFAKAPLRPLTATSEIRSDIQRLRVSLRGALSPAVQAEAWLDDAPLQRAFREQGVDPQRFAMLAVRISCAWSAASVTAKVPLRVTMRQLDEQGEALLRELERTDVLRTEWERSQLAQSLEEIIALSEFLNLLAQTPAGSLTTVGQFQAELRRLLPEDAGLARFEQRASRPLEVKLLPASHEQR